MTLPFLFSGLYCIAWRPNMPATHRTSQASRTSPHNSAHSQFPQFSTKPAAHEPWPPPAGEAPAPARPCTTARGRPRGRRRRRVYGRGRGVGQPAGAQPIPQMASLLRLPSRRPSLSLSVHAPVPAPAAGGEAVRLRVQLPSKVRISKAGHCFISCYLLVPFVFFFSF